MDEFSRALPAGTRAGLHERGHEREGGCEAMVAKAAAAWGEPVPEWVRALAEAADCHGQRGAAERIGMSTGVVSAVLGKKYRGDVERVEQRVRGAFLGLTVGCPVLGEISTVDCMGHQARPFPACANAVQVRLFRACRACAHRRIQR